MCQRQLVITPASGAIDRGLSGGDLFSRRKTIMAIYQDEKEKWCLDFRLGKYRKQFTGKNAFNTKAEAEAKLEEMRTDYRRGALKFNQKEYTYADLVDKYVSEYLIRESLNYKTELHRINPSLTEFGPLCAKTILPSDINRWMNKVVSRITTWGTQVKPSTANNYKRAMSAIINWSTRMGYFQGDNPCRQVKKKAEEKPHKRIISLAEVGALIKAAPNQRTIERMFIVFKTGIRPKQAKALNWDSGDVDLDKRRIIVRNAKKRGNTYIIQMDDELFSFFSSKVKSGLNKGRVFDFTNHKRENKATIENSGINKGKPFYERFTMYGLKHTFATEAINAGASPWEVSKLFGHADDQMVKRVYADLLDPAKAKTPARVSWTDLVAKSQEIIPPTPSITITPAPSPSVQLSNVEYCTN